MTVRFFDAMIPAKGIEERALSKASVPTLDRGAALKSVCRKRPAAVDIKEKPAADGETAKAVSRALRRAAFRHFLKKRF